VAAIAGFSMQSGILQIVACPLDTRMKILRMSLKKSGRDKKIITANYQEKAASRMEWRLCVRQARSPIRSPSTKICGDGSKSSAEYLRRQK
jgi:hypothetical protein